MEHYRSRIYLLEVTNNKFSLYSTLEAIGKTLLIFGRKDEAVKYRMQALSVLRSLNKPLYQITDNKFLESGNLIEIAQIYLDLDDFSRALEIFRERGGKAVLATLWAVADESTARLMSEFYRLRKENPQMSKAEAMQKAQTAMLSGNLKSNETGDKRDVGVLQIGKEKRLPGFETDKNAPFAHPFYWSPFVLIGNWK